MAKVSPHRSAIVNLCRSGMKAAAIATRLKCSIPLVYKVLAQWRKTGDVQEKKKQGRPRTVNTRKSRGIIKKRITRNDGVSLNKMAKSLGMARSTLQSIVHNDLGLKSYRLLNGQQLTDQAKQKRLEKCKELKKFFRVRRLEDVLWSDEKVFTIEVAKNSQNHRQLLSPGLKNSRRRKFATKTLFPKSLMVWGGVSANGTTELIFIDKSIKINAKTYQDEIIKKAIIPWKQINPGMIFQQDWAPAHGAKSTLAFLDTKIKDYLGKDLWPPNSPDLSPLDFSVWGVLDEHLSRQKINNLQDLRRELLKAWAKLDLAYLRRTVESVKKRIQACIDADGGHFENLL